MSIKLVLHTQWCCLSKIFKNLSYKNKPNENTYWNMNKFYKKANKTHYSKAYIWNKYFNSIKDVILPIAVAMAIFWYSKQKRSSIACVEKLK